MNLEHAVGRAIAEHALWRQDETVAVAVSGGADSVALLHLLVRTQRWHRGELSVATVDHGLRPDAAADAAWVAALAADLRLTCVIGTLSVPRDTEDDARAARYAFLDALPTRRVALAHHQRDQAETVLFRLMRGTGPRGLAGIPRVRGRYVRPLLDIAPDRLREWLAARGLTWREDPSNADPRFTRNRIRADVLPLLEAIRPGATAAIARSATAAAAIPCAFDPGDRTPATAWRAPRHRLLATLQSRYSGMTIADVERLRRQLRLGDGAVALTGGVQFRVADGHAWCEKRGNPAEMASDEPV